MLAIRTLQNGIKKEVSSANNLVKELADVEALMDAKIVAQENMEYYTNLRDMYVRVHFGNNVILPFYIDNNVATCLKVSKPRESNERKLLSVTKLKELFGLKRSDTIEDVQVCIKEEYGEELRIETETKSYFKSKKTPIVEAMSALEGTAWEASLKRFMGEVEPLLGNPERLASDSDLVRKAKRISSILSMMEEKQKKILETKEVEPNLFIEKATKTSKSYNKEDVEAFLKVLQKENRAEYERLTQNKSKEEPSMKMVGIFHLDELIDISPDLQSILDMELNNKVDYKIKLFQSGKLNSDIEEKHEIQEQNDVSVDMGAQGLDDEVSIEEIEEMEYGNLSPSF